MKKKILTSLLALLLAFTAYLHAQSVKSLDITEYMTKEQLESTGVGGLSKDQKKELNKWLTGFVTNLIAEVKESNSGDSSSSEEQRKEVTVYVTKTGSKYHRNGCRYLRTSKIESTLSRARARGLTPCKVCRP